MWRLYPMNPASGEYVLGAPQLPKVVMRVAQDERRGTCCGAKALTVIARNLSAEDKYVKSVALNGVPLKGFTIRHEDILKGGELVFEMAGRSPAE